MDRVGEVILGLHAGALAGDDRDADPGIGACIIPGKPVARREAHTGMAPACLGADRIGDAVDGARRIFAGPGHLDEGLAGGFVRIDHVQLGNVRGELVGIGQPAPGVVRHRGGHIEGAPDQFRQGVSREVGRRNDRLLPPAKHP